MASFPASSRRCSGSWVPSGSTCIWTLRESARGAAQLREGSPSQLIDHPRCPPRTPGIPGSLAVGVGGSPGWAGLAPRDLPGTHRPRARRTAPGAAGAALPSGSSCWPRSTAREQGLGEGARASVRRAWLYMPGARLPAPLAPAAPVGGSLAAVWHPAALWALSTVSLRPPRPLLNPLRAH